MNTRTDIVTAVDIGTTKVVAIAGRKNKNGKIEVIGMGQAISTGVKRGSVLNIEETANAVQEAVNLAEERSGVRFKNVFVGIAGQHIKSMRNRGYKFIDASVGEIKQEDVDELTHDMYKIPLEAGEEILHVIPQNYIVDNETGVKNPVGMSGKRLEANFHIVIGQIAHARNIQKCIERSNLNVMKLILEPLASADAVLTDDEKEIGVALIDIGGGTTDIAVYYDGIIRHTAVIPFGGNMVTKDIKEGCAILQRYAEQLKIQYGSALADIAPDDKVVTIPGISGRDSKEISFKTLAHIIQARMEEIIDGFTFELENSGYSEKLGAGIVLTGGGAMMKNLSQLVTFKTGMDVRIGLPSKSMAPGMSKEVLQPMFSTSVGLLLKGFENAEIIPVPEPELEKQPVMQVEKEIEPEEDPLSSAKKEGILKNWKATIKGIFEDNDSRM